MWREKVTVKFSCFWLVIGVGNLKICKFFKFSHRRQFVIVNQKDPPRRFSRDDCDGWRICLACLRHTSHQHYPERGPGVFIHGYVGMIYTNEHTTNNESMSNGFFWSRIFFCFSCVSLSLLNMVLLWEFKRRYLSSVFLKCNKQSLLLPMISLFRLRRCCSGTASYNAAPLGKNSKKNIPSSRLVASVTSYVGKESVTKIGPKQGDHKDCERYFS